MENLTSKEVKDQAKADNVKRTEKRERIASAYPAPMFDLPLHISGKVSVDEDAKRRKEFTAYSIPVGHWATVLYDTPDGLAIFNNACKNAKVEFAKEARKMLAKGKTSADIQDHATKWTAAPGYIQGAPDRQKLLAIQAAVALKLSLMSQEENDGIVIPSESADGDSVPANVEGDATDATTE